MNNNIEIGNIFDEIIIKQETLYDIFENDINQFDKFSQDFINDRDSFVLLIKMIENVMQSRPKLLSLCVECFNNLVPQLKSLIPSSELIHIFDGNLTVYDKLCELGVLDYNELKRNQLIFKMPFINSFFEKKYNQNEIVNDEENYSVYQNTVKFSDEDIQENIKRGMNHQKIAIEIANDNTSYVNEVLLVNEPLENLKIPRSYFETNKYLLEMQRIGFSYIEYAALCGSFNVFKFLLLKNFPIKETIAIYAVIGGNPDIIHLLEEKKIHFGDNCVNMAIMFHRNDLVDYLREKYDIPFTHIDLLKSVECFNFRCFVEILNTNPRLLFLEHRRKKTCVLYEAIKFGNFDVVKFAIQYIDINTCCHYTLHPFCLASSNGYFEIMEYLIKDDKVEKNQIDHMGRNAFHLATKSGHVEIMKILLNANLFSIESKTRNWMNALHIGAESGFIKVLEFIADNYPNADINSKTKDGSTPLHLACSNDFPDIVNFLLKRYEATINVNARNNLKQTPLHVAAKKGCINVIKILLSLKRTELNSRDNDGYTPIHLAVLCDSPSVIKPFLENEDVLVEALDNNGYSIFHLAAIENLMNSFKFIYENKIISLYQKDRFGINFFYL